MAQLKLIEYAQKRRQSELAIKETFAKKLLLTKLVAKSRLSIRTWRLKRNTTILYNKICSTLYKLDKNKISKKQLSKILNNLEKQLLKRKIEFEKLMLVGKEIFQNFDPTKLNNHLSYNKDVRAMHITTRLIDSINDKLHYLQSIEKKM